MGQDTGTSVGYCRSCFYDLRGIGTAGRCPECGKAFDLSDPKTFRTHRPRGIWRRLRWVIYPLLLIVLACAGGIGWLWWGWHREQPGIAWVMQHGGSVDTKSIGAPWMRQWMRRWTFLLERSDKAWGIYITPGEIAEQSPLWRLSNLSNIELCDAGVTDEWIDALCQHLQPTDVALYRSSVTAKGLAPLGRLRRMESLNLAGATVGDDGLIHLKDLPELRKLVLMQTRVRGPGLAYLAGLPKLESLSLGGAPVEDSAVAHLANMRNLKFLELAETRITVPKASETLRQSLPECRIQW